MGIGGFVTGDRQVGLIASLIYLLTFNVTNFQLAGLVDSVEAWAIVAVTWALLTRRWLLVPLIGFVGALGKETSIPLVLVFCVAWVASQALRRAEHRAPLWIIAALLVTQVAGVELVQMSVNGHLVAPWQISSSGIPLAYAGQKFPVMPMLREILYSFVWLIPLGSFHLKDLPRPWVVSSGVSLLTVIVLTMSVSVGENVTRPAFDVIGPMLALSAAIFLNRILQSVPRQAS